MRYAYIVLTYNVYLWRGRAGPRGGVFRGPRAGVDVVAPAGVDVVAHVGGVGALVG